MSDQQEVTIEVSIIIPAKNAAETIQSTIVSLQAQTRSDWEAIVIDDGSSDSTAEQVGAFAERDHRVRLYSGPGRGAGAARNVGLALARAPLVLFLDADDTIRPDMIEKMLGALKADPAAEAAHCGWTFTDPESKPIGSERCEESGPDLFRVFTHHCAFKIHACIITRARLEQAGGFDETLRTSEDFDLWQRVARLGTRFTAVADSLSIYRLRRDASWFDASVFLADVLTVLRRGHSSDPRLPWDSIPPEHRAGGAQAELAAKEVRMLTWAAAIALTRGEEFASLFDQVCLPAAHAIDPRDIADALFKAIPLALTERQREWPRLLSQLRASICAFLDALAERAGKAELAGLIICALERRVAEALIEANETRLPLTIGRTAVNKLDICLPISDLMLPDGDHAIVNIGIAGQDLGRILLPVADGRIPAVVLTDAIAGQFSWQILKVFFSRHLYPELRVDREEGGWMVRRGDFLLHQGETDPRADLHNCVGWTIFLQELFGTPQAGLNELYDPQWMAEPRMTRSATEGNSIELPGAIPTILDASDRAFSFDVLIGGELAFCAQAPVRKGRVGAGAVRFALLDQGKLELANAAVREALIGQDIECVDDLRTRLCNAAAAKAARQVDQTVRVSAGVTLAIGSPVSGRAGRMSRRLTLPLTKTDLLLAGLQPEQLVRQTGEGEIAELLFRPELERAVESEAELTNSSTKCITSFSRYFPVLLDGIRLLHSLFDARVRTSPAVDDVANFYSRHHFESLFARGADPWHYTSPYEQKKYQQTLAMLPHKYREHVLEIGCAEGYFTVQLLPLVKSLLAADISEVALQRTAERCSGFSNLRVERLDLAHDDLNGQFDLIICSEILYYMGDWSALSAIGRKLARALRPGGYLVAAHANLIVDDPENPGFDWRMPYGAKVIGETFAATGELIFDKEFRTDLYRIQRFRKPFRKPSLFARLRRQDWISPRSVEQGDFAMPEPDVAHHILWSGGQSSVASAEVTTEALPILMYHHVGDTGPKSLSRWRVSPSTFARQMRYLCEAGFKTASFAEWRAARREGKPLSGRRVIITFDDGYADFEICALPALRENGFVPVMFLPTDHVGGHALWDAGDGDPLSLLNWDTARRLRDAGVQFGAHSRSHRYLTGLDLAQLVDEFVGSRLAIKRELGICADVVAYPFGDYDEIVLRVAAACGFAHGVTTRNGFSGMSEDDLALSRIEVMGAYTIEDFIAALG